MATVVSVEHVSKSYRLGMIGTSSLREDVSRWWAKARRQPDPTTKIGQQHHARQVGNQFWALDDVSFSVAEGEVLGIIGRNGAGKSTLLKILSQVTAPTSGQIRIKGRVASLLEVGTGFHPDLTGRDNVFLNGAIMGMTKSEIRDKFDEIVAFSECEAFIDTPVKRYSSGMYVRLAFAVAAHLEPEILIVDEVLAVGDAQFQRKCLGKMGDVARHGRTILFVSHSMAAVAALCSRAILFKDGRLAAQGSVAEVSAMYQADGKRTAGGDLASGTRRGTGTGRFVAVDVSATDRDGRPLDQLVPGCDVVIRAAIKAESGFKDAAVGLVFYEPGGARIIDVNTLIHREFLTLGPGQSATVTFQLPELLLKPGSYRMDLWVGRSGLEDIDYVEHGGILEMGEPLSAKHSDTLPGVYQCRFSHTIELSPAALAAPASLAGNGLPG